MSIISGVGLDLYGEGQTGLDYGFIEHLAIGINIGKSSTIVIFFLFIEYQFETLAMAEFQRKDLGLIAVLLPLFRGIHTDEPDLDGVTTRNDHQRVAVYNTKELDIKCCCLAREKGQQEKQKKEVAGIHGMSIDFFRN